MMLRSLLSICISFSGAGLSGKATRTSAKRARRQVCLVPSHRDDAVVLSFRLRQQGTSHYICLSFFARRAKKRKTEEDTVPL
jgi:hypothetical protein